MRDGLASPIPTFLLMQTASPVHEVRVSGALSDKHDGDEEGGDDDCGDLDDDDDLKRDNSLALFVHGLQLKEPSLRKVRSDNSAIFLLLKFFGRRVARTEWIILHSIIIHHLRFLRFWHCPCCSSSSLTCFASSSSSARSHDWHIHYISARIFVFIQGISPLAVFFISGLVVFKDGIARGKTWNIRDYLYSGSNIANNLLIKKKIGIFLILRGKYSQFLHPHNLCCSSAIYSFDCLSCMLSSFLPFWISSSYFECLLATKTPKWPAEEGHTFMIKMEQNYLTLFLLPNSSADLSTAESPQYDPA